MALSQKVKIAVLRDNLNAQHRDYQKLSKLRLAYLDDLAHVAYDFLSKCKWDDISMKDALSLLRDRCREESEFVLELSDSCTLSTEDQYAFSHFLALRLLASSPMILKELFPASNNNGVVAFVKNRTTEDFFEQIKDFYLLQHSICANDFREAALKVLGNEADFCLLPYAEKGHFPIFGIIDAVLKTDLRLLGLIHKEDITYGIYGKGFCFDSADSYVLQYIAPQDTTFPRSIEDKIIERFSYQIGNRFHKVDTLQKENLESILAALLYFELFAREVKIIGLANILQI